MREEAVNVPESELNNALGRTERSDTQKGLPGRRETGPPESPVRGARGIVEPGRSTRHATKCRICNHPDRHAIEFEFLNWRNPADLARSYKLRDLTTIYRHAHATGLFAKRRLNLRFAMERIVERVNEVPVTATSVIRAARAISRINDSGEWIDPPSRVIVTHINRLEDCEAPGVADAEASPAPRRRGTTKITAGSARSSLRASRASRLSLDTSARLGGRGTSPDKENRSSHSSLRARTAGQGAVPDNAAHDASAALSTRHSTLATVFDEVLLDEPSESASAELPRIDGKPAPPEVILQLTPEFARCREERRRALEADRAARAASASGSGGFTPPASSQTENAPSSSSLLPQAAFPTSASSALPHPAANENNVADDKQSVAMPSSSLPPAAPDKPATACPELGRRSEAEALSLPKGGAKQSPRAAGPPLGSSGSADPPFPFTPEPLRRWKPRRRF